MRYCLLGEKLSHSYSAEIHGSLGLDYSLQEVPKERLKSFLLSGLFDGFNVTIPYKKDVMPYLDGIDQLAKEIGAVNTVKSVNGKLFGYNTDYFGLSYMLESADISLTGKCVAILGSGGAKNTAEVLCKRQGAKAVYVVSRSGKINYQNVYDLTDIQVIINATPVGMYPNTNVSPLDLTMFKNLQAVADCIYNPLTTKLLSDAKALNLKTCNGLKMLVAQAIKAEEIWLDTTFQQSTIETTYDWLLKKKRNVVLFGMPSCGKSTLGNLLAKKSDRKFIDIDVEVFNLTGQTPAQIITCQGEQAFRDVESEVCANFSKQSSLIIATGGGSVLREENQRALKQNGIAVHIDRPIEQLITEGRPLSQKQGIKELYNQRKDIYSAFADIVIKNDGNLESALKELTKLL